MNNTQPPLNVDLRWDADLRFTATHRDHSWILDGKNQAGPSPVALLASTIAGCMAIDILHILIKGRHTIDSLTAELGAFRAEQDPKRFTRVNLQFKITSSASREAVQRAIDLSREKYCSIWHSMRQDIELKISFDLAPIN
jgi:putative redox protein